MNTFEITVERTAGDGWPVVVEQRGPASALELRTEGTLALAASYEADLRAAALDPKAYGTLLGQALFRDEVPRRLRPRRRRRRRRRCTCCCSSRRPSCARCAGSGCAPRSTAAGTSLALDQRHALLPLPAQRRPTAASRRSAGATCARWSSPPARPGWSGAGSTPFDVAAAVARRAGVARGAIPGRDVPGRPVEGGVGPPTLDALCERDHRPSRYTLLHVVVPRRGSRPATARPVAVPGRAGRARSTRCRRRALIERLGELRGAAGCRTSPSCRPARAPAPEAEGVLGGLAPAAGARAGDAGGGGDDRQGHGRHGAGAGDGVLPPAARARRGRPGAGRGVRRAGRAARHRRAGAGAVQPARRPAAVQRLAPDRPT